MAEKLKQFIITKLKITNELYQLLMYLTMGVLTTAISFLSFYLFEQVIGLDYRLANFLSWAAAVIFAYLSNRSFVFASQETGIKSILIEFIRFASSRLITLVIEMLLLIALVEWLDLSSLFAKIVTNVGVLVLNYLLSKLLVFKDN